MVLATPRTGRTQTPSLTLTWQAPPPCPDEAFVRGEVDRLLEGGPRPTAQIEAHAVVSRTAEDRWRVHLATIRDGAAGERTIEAASCRPLAEATALVVALTIDPARVAARHVDATRVSGGPSGAASAGAAAGASPSPLPAAPEQTAAAAPAVVTPPPPAPAQTPPAPAQTTATAPPIVMPLSAAPTHTTAPPRGPPARTERPTAERARSATATVHGRVPLHAAIFAAAGGDLGTLPAPAIAASLSAAVLVGPVRLEAYGEHWFARTADTGGAPSYAGAVSLTGGGAAGCFTVGHGLFDVAPCAGVELGDLHGVGLPSINDPSQSDGWWVAVVGAAHATFRLFGPLRLGLRIEAAVPLIRDRFVVDVNGQPVFLFRSNPVAGRAFLGPELRF